MPRHLRNLGLEFHILPIKAVHDAYEETLAPAFMGRPQDVTEENLQARVRGALLMAFSNKFNHLLLTTGNKSEMAVGYCTLYGDMCGGLAVISDVPKTVVYQMAEYINEEAGRDLIRATRSPSRRRLNCDRTRWTRIRCRLTKFWTGSCIATLKRRKGRGRSLRRGLMRAPCCG